MPSARSYRVLRGSDAARTTRNLLSQVPKSAQPWVATLLRTGFEQPDTDADQARIRHLLDALETKCPKPHPTWTPHSTTCRLHRVPAGDLVRQPAGAAEQGDPPSHRRGRDPSQPHRRDPARRRGRAERNDEWTEARRYMELDRPAKARLQPIESETDDTALPAELTALPQNEITGCRQYTTPAVVTDRAATVPTT